MEAAGEMPRGDPVPDRADLYHTGIVAHDLERAKAGRFRGQAAPTTSVLVRRRPGHVRGAGRARPAARRPRRNR